MSGLTLTQKMNAFKGMTTRNIKVFFKDKVTLFFSILTPLIVLGLYIIFLKATYMNGITSELEPVKDLIKMSDVENIGNTWLISGILGTSTITVALNSLSVMVGDKDKKIDYDYNSSPAYGSVVVFSYFVGAFINTLLIAVSVLTFSLIAMSFTGDLYLTASIVLQLYLVTAIGCASSTMIMMIILSFFKNGSSLGAFEGIVSAAVGFIIGAYVPLGNFSSGVQTVLSFIPGSHIASLYRQLLMTNVTENIGKCMGEFGGAEFVETIKREFSFSLSMFSYKTSMLFSYLYSIGSILLGFGINVILYKKASKRK